MQSFTIYELTPDTPIASLSLSAFVERVGLLVYDHNPIDTRRAIEELPVTCAALALVTNRRLRPHRRLAVCMGLSSEHGCPCHIFQTPEQARAWLQQQVRR